MEDRDKRKAQKHRTAAAAHRVAAQRHMLMATMVETGAAFRELHDTMTAGDARDVATHPDLAEWNVQMDAFYGSA
ncbi:hypothetical protein SEA_GILGAMESH_141 [Streptomyces phage Gilgamesh]|uniref:Uncharacterized protein n=1 Tax=Streptomyces phage Gilgamesh TaxID=2599890 RepID=A0A5J6TRA5_9CAUD|nr:hypothetical protein QEH35_gp141 [Streptomyces phage Gilgamesh]QFG13333.1 hypothetical protein SEA_GILGAMESH_141 [Streptomyces phage Gilgamesh]